LLLPVGNLTAFPAFRQIQITLNHFCHPAENTEGFNPLRQSISNKGSAMSEKRYHIEFSGKIIPGWDIDEVKANLAKLLKANEEKLYQLFSSRRFIIFNLL
jgi:hypothetical protein